LNNNQFETTHLNQAAYLLSRKVPFNGLKRLPTGQAVFLFDNPSDEILADWIKEPGKFIKSYENARNYLRDILEGRR